MLKCCLFGAGRIGAVHAENIARHPGAELRWVIDPSEKAGRELAEATGARWSDAPGDGLADRGIDAVFIASPTPTHVELIVAAARAGKAIFCEKPIDLEMMRVEDAVREVEEAKVPFFIAFNRRFDPSFRKIKADLAQGVVGRLELVQITSRDPGPPPAEYLRQSGGLFRDMMIHDLDMARWLLGDEPVEVYAAGSALVDPAIQEFGDVDTAIVVLRTREGILAQITNSRRAAYGYDQRLEVLGSNGMLQAENTRSHTVSTWTEAGVVHDKPPHFFIERYAEAYRAELDHFVAAVGRRDRPLLTGVHDGRQALLLADAALESWEMGRPVRLD